MPITHVLPTREYLVQFIESFARTANVEVTTWRDPFDKSRLTGAFSTEDSQFVWPFELSISDMEAGPTVVARVLDDVVMRGKDRMCSGVSV